MVSEFRRGFAQLRVLVLQVVDATFQVRDAIQLPLSAFRRRQTIAGALPLQLDLLLRLHVDRAHAGRWRRTGAAGGRTSQVGFALQLYQSLVGEDSLGNHHRGDGGRHRGRGRDGGDGSLERFGRGRRVLTRRDQQRQRSLLRMLRSMKLRSSLRGGRRRVSDGVIRVLNLLRLLM